MVNGEALKIAKNFLSVVSRNYSVKSAYLFGSFAKENFHADSDIDIAIVLDQKDFTFSHEMELVRLRREIDLRIEPHTFLKKDFHVNNQLVFEILKYGIRLV